MALPLIKAIRSGAKAVGADSAAGAVVAAPFVGQLARPVIDEVTGASSRERIEEALRRAYPAPGGMADRMGQLRRLMQENEQRLAMMNPHLYAELRAGEKLVPGEEVYGASDRTRIENVLMGMIQGEYTGDTP